MPSRVLRDTYATSDTIAALPPGPQDRFPRYLLAADDFGCMRLDPTVIDALLFSKRQDVTAAVVTSDLAAYEAAGLLLVWTVGGKNYCFLRGWFDNQNKPRGMSRRKTPIPPPMEKSSHFAISANADKLVQDGHPQSMSQSKSISQSIEEPKEPIASQSPADRPAGALAAGLELFAEPATEPKPKRAKREKPKPDPRVILLRDRWALLYHEATGREYTPAFGRDGRALLAMLGVKLGGEPITEAEIERRFKNALTMPFYRGGAGHLGTVWSHFSGLAVAATGPPAKGGALAPAPSSAYTGGPSGFT